MPLDDADKKIIADLIGSSLKTFGEGLDQRFVTPEAATKMVEQGTTKALEAIDFDGKLNAFADKLKGSGGDDGGTGGKGQDGGGGSGSDPAVAKLQEQIEALTAQSQAAQAAAQAAEQKNREQRLENSLREQLGAAGVPAAAQQKAVAYLRTLSVDGKPVITLNDAGDPVYRQQRKGYVDERPLAEGIKDWAGSDDGKLYLPATNAGGTGDGNGGRSNQGGGGNVPRKSDGSVNFGSLTQGGLRLGGIAQ